MVTRVDHFGIQAYYSLVRHLVEAGVEPGGERIDVPLGQRENFHELWKTLGRRPSALGVPCP